MQLELQNVGYSYNGKELVLRHVNYRFEGGRIYAITGRSGAGKTTLLSLLSQLTKPTEERFCTMDWMSARWISIYTEVSMQV